MSQFELRTVVDKKTGKKHMGFYPLDRAGRIEVKQFHPDEGYYPVYSKEVARANQAIATRKIDMKR